MDLSAQDLYAKGEKEIKPGGSVGAELGLCILCILCISHEQKQKLYMPFTWFFFFCLFLFISLLFAENLRREMTISQVLQRTPIDVIHKWLPIH